jgi:hypothetical protein
MNDQATTQFVRSVDALERLFYRYAERNAAHFGQAAEFDVRLTETQVRTALAAVQASHPLLSVHVEDRPGCRLGLYRAESVAPIDLTVHESECSWASFAAAELAHKFDRSIAPLMRAVLINHRTGSTILLTFDHTTADGISSVTVMNDLVKALNGQPLARRDVPPSMEELVACTVPYSETPAAGDSRDPRMAQPASIRPFDGTHPDVRTATLDTNQTARLLQRCRAERTTVHAALVAAASRAHAKMFGRQFVRTLSPINTRPLLGGVGDCADYFVCTVTGMTPWDGTAFWDQARAVTGDLTIARSASGVAEVSAAIEQAMTVDAESAVAEQLFTEAFPFDLLITNLGVQELDVCGPIRPTTVWGPILQSQIDDHVIGVTTYGGQMRMVVTGYLPSTAFTAAVKETLVHFSGYRPS